MKLTSMCIACQVWVRLHDVWRIVGGEDERVKVMTSLVREMGRLLSQGVDNPAVLGTMLFRFVKRVTGVEDPYRDDKVRADLAALRVYEAVKARGIGLEEALRLSVYANAMDLGVAGYKPPNAGEVVEKALSRPVYGVKEAVEALRSARRIVFLLDNAGEVVLDRVLADVLRGMGKEVYAVVKSGAFQNDETLGELEYSRLDESFDGVLGSGSDAASLFLEEADRRVLELIGNVDLVVAKGMAHYEYLTDYGERLGKPILFLLVAKCDTVASSLRVPRGYGVARLWRPRPG